MSTSKRLPPASLQTFLRSYDNMPGLVFTDHEREYTNVFYNSLFDDINNIAYTYYNTSEEDDINKDTIQYYVANISKALAKALYEEITNRSVDAEIDNGVLLVIIAIKSCSKNKYCLLLLL